MCSACSATQQLLAAAVQRRSIHLSLLKISANSSTSHLAVHLEDGQLNVSCKQQKQSMRSLPVSACQLQARTLCSMHVQHVVQQAAKAEEPGHRSFRTREISMALLQQLANSTPCKQQQRASTALAAAAQRAALSESASPPELGTSTKSVANHFFVHAHQRT
jgi:hypothetical protein